MTKTTFLFALPLAFAFAVNACSSSDPGGPSRPYTSHGGGGSSGSGGGTNSGSGGGTGSGGGGGGGATDYDAGPVPGSVDYDAAAPGPGNGGGADAGGGSAPDAGGGNTAPAGSCGNPNCISFNGYCGCRATDSNGNTVELGCQPGGQCGCFTNGTLDGNTVSDTAVACDSKANTASRFATDCTCQ